MTKSVEKIILLRDFDGDVTPFDASVLQTRLAGCFLSSGRQESSYLAEDIVLALEYALLNAPRSEAIFGKGEVDAALIRLLEETGFPEVARRYRSGGNESIVMISTKTDSICELLRGHLSCSESRLAAIVLEVTEAARKLEMEQATPHMLMELARHYERRRNANDMGSDIIGVVPEVTLSSKEIIDLLPAVPRQLVQNGILSINGITSLFPSVRFMFRMKKFSEYYNIGKPLIELEFEPPLYRAAAALESSRRAIENKLQHSESLPCCLAIPDFFDFLSVYAGPGEHQALATEITEVLTSYLECELYKLSF